MNKTKLFLLLLSGTFFTACTSSSVALVPKSPMYQLGETDGCTTAQGTYTKNSENFRNNTEYSEGWFAGRKNCNPVNDAK